MGWMCVAVGAVSTYSMTQMNWYHLKPSFLLVRDLRDPGLRGRAAQELKKRLEINALPLRQRNAAADQFVRNLMGWQGRGRIYDDEFMCIGKMMSTDSFTSSQLAELTAHLTALRYCYKPGRNRLRLSGHTMIPDIKTVLGLVPKYSLDVVSVDGKDVDNRVLDVVLPRAFDPERSTGGISLGYSPHPHQTIRAEKEIKLHVTTTWCDFHAHMPELRRFGLNTKNSLNTRDDVRVFKKLIHQLMPNTVSHVESEATLSTADKWVQVDLRSPTCHEHTLKDNSVALSRVYSSPCSRSAANHAMKVDLLLGRVQ